MAFDSVWRLRDRRAQHGLGFEWSWSSGAPPASPPSAPGPGPTASADEWLTYAMQQGDHSQDAAWRTWASNNGGAYMDWAARVYAWYGAPTGDPLQKHAGEDFFASADYKWIVDAGLPVPSQSVIQGLMAAKTTPGMTKVTTISMPKTTTTLPSFFRPLPTQPLIPGKAPTVGGGIPWELYAGGAVVLGIAAWLILRRKP